MCIHVSSRYLVSAQPREAALAGRVISSGGRRALELDESAPVGNRVPARHRGGFARKDKRPERHDARHFEVSFQDGHKDAKTGDDAGRLDTVLQRHRATAHARRPGQHSGADIGGKLSCIEPQGRVTVFRVTIIEVTDNPPHRASLWLWTEQGRSEEHMQRVLASRTVFEKKRASRYREAAAAA